MTYNIRRTVMKASGWELVKCAGIGWARNGAATEGAALAFYCAFSLAPLLVVLATLTGWVVGADAATQQLDIQLSALFGAGTASSLMAFIKSSQTKAGVVAAAVSAGTLLVGASTVFAVLQSSLQRMFGTTKLAPKGLRGFIRERILSFGLILALGFLLLVSLSISTAIAGLRSYLAHHHEGLVALAAALDLALSLLLITGLITLIYRYLPAQRLPWRPILWGALVTSLLFQAGRWAISFYLARSTQPTAFGAAASFAALLLWLYYSAQIFLFGAELTSCMGERREPAAEPRRNSRLRAAA